MTTGSTSRASAAAPAIVLPGDLVDDIARNLEGTGEYRVILTPGPPQQLIDLRWAALAAGRALGRRVDVAVTRAGVDPSHQSITVRMTCTRTRTSIPRQRRSKS
jgi:hypothetical protein